MEYTGYKCRKCETEMKDAIWICPNCGDSSRADFIISMLSSANKVWARDYENINAENKRLRDALTTIGFGDLVDSGGFDQADNPINIVVPLCREMMISVARDALAGRGCK